MPTAIRLALWGADPPAGAGVAKFEKLKRAGFNWMFEGKEYVRLETEQEKRRQVLEHLATILTNDGWGALRIEKVRCLA